MLVEVKVGALIMDPNSNSPIVVLKGIQDETVLPIWVGNNEANAIALEIEKIVPPRPLTHDLMKNLIHLTGYAVKRVIITDLKENTFYASLELTDQNGKKFLLDARPSDAIALALRADCPIFISRNVLEISTSIVEKPENESTVINSTAEDWPDLIG